MELVNLLTISIYIGSAVGNYCLLRKELIQSKKDASFLEIMIVFVPVFNTFSLISNVNFNSPRLWNFIFRIKKNKENIK
jgi:hypothetical protein